jgi:hypothetical protein
MAIFLDLDNKFQILDYLATHDQLLVRSMKNRSRDYNIDIIFKGVSLFMTSTCFVGLEISLYELDSNSLPIFKEFEFKTTLGYKVFKLKNSHGDCYFINALAFGAFHNKLDILETSLGRYDWGDLGEMIFWYSD